MILVKRHKWFFLVLLLCLVLAGAGIIPVSGQSLPGGSMFFTSSRTHKVQIRFRLVNNLIIIPLVINHSDTLRFILDTGIENTIISELSLGESLALRYKRVTRVTGLGMGKPVDAVVSTGNTFSLPGIEGTGQTVFVLLQDVFELSQALGMRVHGLIGYRLFSNFIVRIDYERNVITLYDPDHYHPRPRRHTTELPLTFATTKPYVEARIVDHAGDTVPVRLLVDTGLSFGLWLLPGSSPGISIPPHSVPTYLGTGLNGRINGRLARLSSFILGPYIFPDPVVGFPDTLAFQPVRTIDGRNGTLGSEILRRFDVVIDYPHQKMILHPNRFFREPFRTNNAGIYITAPIPGFRYYIISDIRKNSPACRAGLKKGDRLYKINGKNTDHMSMNEIYRIFQKKPGSLIRIKVIRNGLIFDTRFYLEKFL